MAPCPTPLERAVQIPPPQGFKELTKNCVKKCYPSFFGKAFFVGFNKGEPNRKISEKEVNFTNHGMFVVRSSFLEEKLVVRQVQQRGLCPAAKLRGQGEGVVLVSF